ncbi:myelin-associated glycoprotein-like [Antennarius striatus]|uniref:myelin-associated glycoprotein-like n=1 Tax=Antennarius striatus TaxID=241820 RepID=UPI0035B23D00
MTGAVKVAFICCLIPGISCQNWAIFMPQSVQGLSGSCVQIPCTFSLPYGWDHLLDASCEAIWKRGTWGQGKVFESILTGDNIGLNILPWVLTGNLREKNCTTIFHWMPGYKQGSYYFGLECDNQLKYDFQSSVFISFQGSHPIINIAPSRVMIGTQVRLTCSALVTCPFLRPTLTWTPRIGHVEEVMEPTMITSIMHFTASQLHSGLRFQCSVVYWRQDGMRDIWDRKSVTFDVYYPPRTTSVSYNNNGSVTEGTGVTLHCNSDANPPVKKYTWFKVDTNAKETPVGYGMSHSTTVSETNSRFYCRAINSYGTQNSSIAQIDVLFSPKDTQVMVTPPGPVLEGSSVSLACRSHANPPPTHYTWYKDGNQEEETTGVLVLNGTELISGTEYRCIAKNNLGANMSPKFQLIIQLAPEILPSSSCIEESSKFRCSCRSRGNPLPSLIWELAGEAIKDSADIPIRETRLGNSETRSSITLSLADEDVSSLVCRSINSQGNDSFTFSKAQQGLLSTSILIGPLMGVLGMLVCVSLIFLFYRKRKVSRSPHAAPETRTQVDAIYTNTALLERRGGDEEDSVHYADVNFVKLQARREGGLGGEEGVRGLASQTDEYAQVYPHCRRHSGGD